MPERPQPVKFLRLIEHFDHGALVEQIDDDLLKAVRAAKLHNAKASIALTITIKPGGGSAVEIGVEERAKIPRRKLDRAELHVHPDGQLHYHHHEQKQIDYEAAEEKRPKPTGDMS